MIWIRSCLAFSLRSVNSSFIVDPSYLRFSPFEDFEDQNFAGKAFGCRYRKIKKVAWGKFFMFH